MTIANTVTLEELIKGRLFRVPEYQRPYAWEIQQLTDFWTDLDLLGPNSRDGHFSGTLILRETTANSDSTVADIVDGQQRLTTCFLLLSRIRHACLNSLRSEQSHELAATIYSNYLRTGPERWNPLRLTLAPSLDNYWKDVVVEDSPRPTTRQSGAERLLVSAIDFFDKRIELALSSVGEEQWIAVLSDLYLRIARGLRFIHYAVSSTSDVGVIFETVNDRGIALTELEKVKNYLLFLTQKLDASPASDLTEHIQACWTEIHRNVGSDRRGGDNLLRAYWLATRGSARSAPRGAQAVKLEFDRAKYLPDSYRLGAANTDAGDTKQSTLYFEINSFVSQLRDCSVFYYQFSFGESEYSSFEKHDATRANDLTALLRRAGGTAKFLPLIFVQRMKDPRDGDAYCGLLEACLTHRVRVSVVCGYRAGTGVYGLAQHAKAAWSSEREFDLARKVLANCAYYASDAQVWDKAGSPSNWYTRPSLKFLLYEYEKHLTGGKGHLRPFEEFQVRDSIEHIAPQKVTHGWKGSFGEDRDLRYRHSLGNLVLTYDNSSYSNKSFRRKQTETPGYRSSYLLQERELASDFTEWTPETVMQRQEKLISWVLEEWPLTVPSDGDSGEASLPDLELESLGGDADA